MLAVTISLSNQSPIGRRKRTLKPIGLYSGLLAIVAMLHAVTLCAEEPPNAAWSEDAKAEFFEKQVRPVLIETCCECHGRTKQEAGLRLDSREALIAGSENGPVVVPGRPDASRLVRAIGYQDATLQMPPSGKLSAETIASLTEWIKLGVPWPEAASNEAATAAVSLADEWASHWAFQPVRDLPPPAVKNAAWPQSPIDLFVLARLEAAEIAPSPPADRRTLVRRLYFDLLGLPPTPDETESFVGDESPLAIERLVDRLLASPQYGERWGRRWLDLARYADNKGYKFFSSDELYAYTYRDWVVRAFNDDMPYDQFIIAQLAADRLATGDDNRPLAAMGFLTVGRRFLEDTHDIIDDRIDVVGRGLLGLTISCARCHDHKFDPIPTADYYSLYGVFAGSAERTRTLLPAQPTPEELEFAKELKTREDALDEYLHRRHRELLAAFRSQVAEYLLAGHAAQKVPPTDKFMFVEEPGKLSQLIIGNWRALLDRTSRTDDPIFAPWHAFAALEGDFGQRAAELIATFARNADAEHPLNRRVAALFAGPPPKDLADLARRYGELFSAVENEWQAACQAATAGIAPAEHPIRLPGDDDEALRGVLYGSTSPCDLPLTDVEFLVGRPGQAEIGELRKKITEFLNASKQRLPRSMVLEESPELCRYQPHVFVRGKPANLGAAVPRQFLSVLAGPARKPFEQGSGRLELARAIADANNPLTARVLVNRVWLEHFGVGLVRTPSDFGLRSEPPSHPELLDWLAAWFARSGWSIKQLHRLIVLSATYQQASHTRPEAAALDPENRLLWRMNRRRLDLEAMRDSLLAVAGKLDATPGGLPVDILAAPYSRRRTIYGFVDRQNLPGLFRVFDFAVPDTHSPQRYTTTVPQQALYLMNHPFTIEQAQHVARRDDVTALADPAQRIDRLYRVLFSRPPTATEIALGTDFAATSWERYVHALVMTNEFVFVD